ncbi:MAG TPA: metal ABC transporter ATP-binding protein [Verrucomicrobiae bacterium]|nr:metal ABC transporter ATP-binding protein [Verrucomicrobiae bacterium]
MNSEVFLRLEHVAVGYDRRVLLPDVNLTLRRGSFTGLLGANGSGKSTLIKAIVGIIPPLGGRVEFASVDGRAHNLGYTPQRDSLDPIFLLSSFEVVLMGTCGRVRPGRRIGRTEKEWAHQCLGKTGAAHLSRKLFSELSGGQKQRVLIARALATKPDFLLLDEPTSGIDVAARQAIMDLLKGIHEQHKLTILMASHDLPLVRMYAPDVIWLHQGKVLHGPAKEFLSPQKVEEILDLEMH